MNIFNILTIQEVLDNLYLVFQFLFARLGDVANFFVSNILGIIILGIVVFGILIDYVIKFFHR